MLLLEAGGKDRSPNIKIPAAFANQFHTKLDWDYPTEPEPHCAGRSLYIPRGKTLGGSSSMNAMLYVRGRPLDYDLWEAAGATGWGWADVLPYFLKAENNERGASEFHAVGGPLNVAEQRSPRAARREVPGRRRGGGHPAHRRLQRARAGRRIDVPGHPAAAAGAGARPTPTCGPRSAATNLRVVTGAHVLGLEIEAAVGDRRALRAPREARAHGARGARGDPGRRRRSARRSCCCCPGSARRTTCARWASRCATTSPGVGERLQDHPFVTVLFEVSDPHTLYGADKPKPLAEWLLRRSGPLTSTAAEVTAFVRTRAGPAGRRRLVPHRRALLRGPRRPPSSTGTRPRSGRCW